MDRRRGARRRGGGHAALVARRTSPRARRRAYRVHHDASHRVDERLAHVAIRGHLAHRALRRARATLRWRTPARGARNRNRGRVDRRRDADALYRDLAEASGRSIRTAGSRARSDDRLRRKWLVHTRLRVVRRRRLARDAEARECARRTDRDRRIRARDRGADASRTRRDRLVRDSFSALHPLDDSHRAMAAKKRVVVLGARGVFGSLLVRELADRYEVVPQGRGEFDPRNAFAVACTAGPFQQLDRGLARKTVEAGAHWLDIADDEGWFFDLVDDRDLDALARAKNVAVIPGLSSLPAVSGALVRRLGAAKNVTITLHINNRNAKGVA